MHVLITGTTGGIGGAVKHALEASGAQITKINRENADLSSVEAIQNLRQNEAARGPYDWVIFSHGYVDAEKNFLLQRPQEIEKAFFINTLSVIYLTQILLPTIKPGGGIIFISSIAAVTANGFTPPTHHQKQP